MSILPAAPPYAGVRVPPPAVYAAGILAGWGLDRWHRWPIDIAHPTARLALALAFAIIWLVIFVSAFGMFRRFRTPVIPNRPASALVTEGVYRFTRNPIYISFAFLYIGAALAVNTWWAVLLLAIVVIVIDRAVIAREERYLASVFPESYSAYRSRVRRWL